MYLKKETRPWILRTYLNNKRTFAILQKKNIKYKKWQLPLTLHFALLFTPHLDKKKLLTNLTVNCWLNGVRRLALQDTGYSRGKECKSHAVRRRRSSCKDQDCGVVRNKDKDSRTLFLLISRRKMIYLVGCKYSVCKNF